MRGIFFLLVLTSLACGWSGGRLGPYKVEKVEPGISTAWDSYIIQFYVVGSASANGCNSGEESKLIAPGGQTPQSLQQAKDWDADLMAAFMRNANVWVTYSGSYCNATALEVAP